MRAIRKWVKSRVSPRTLVLLRCLTRGFPIPRWGNLRRTQPFSHYGGERGTAIDRFYLHRFLDQHRHLITGKVLEIQLPGYTKRYGHDLTATDTVDISSEANRDLTYLCDLAQSEGVIPDAVYDCFLLPNTLCAMRDIEGCLRQALRVVRPGGVILATTPGGCVPRTGDGSDYWRMGADGWRELTNRAWPGCETIVEQHGSYLTAVAAMIGLAHEELRREELEVYDSRYPVMITLFCRRPMERSI